MEINDTEKPAGETVVIKGFAIVYTYTVEGQGWFRSNIGPSSVQANDLPEDLRESIHRFLLERENQALAE